VALAQRTTHSLRLTAAGARGPAPHYRAPFPKGGPAMLSTVQISPAIMTM
jgi:hypothetical protein